MEENVSAAVEQQNDKESLPGSQRKIYEHLTLKEAES